MDKVCLFRSHAVFCEEFAVNGKNSNASCCSPDCKGGIFMKKMSTLFRDSYHELFRVRSLTIIAMLMACSLILSRFSIKLPQFRISFSPIVKMYIGALFGPVAGGVTGIALDLIGFFLSNDGSAFFPGYTLTEALGIFIYGLFFYKRKLTFPRILAAKFTVMLVCNILLGTLWIYMMTGKAFLPLLMTRSVKNLIQWPVDSILFFILAASLEKAKIRRLLHE